MCAKLAPVAFLLALLTISGCNEGMEDEGQEEAEDTANIVPTSGMTSPL